MKDNKLVIVLNKKSELLEIQYGWKNVPDVNLINSSGLPASPFRIQF
nr:hypothetical protein [Flavobacterium sp. Fl-318]